NGDRQVAIAVAAATDLLWDAQGCYDEGARLYRRVERWIDDSTPVSQQARFWLSVSRLRMQIGARDQANAGLKAASVFCSLNEPFLQARAFVAASQAYANVGDLDAAKAALAEVDRIVDPSWPAWFLGAAELARATYMLFCDRPDALRAHATNGVE